MLILKVELIAQNVVAADPVDGGLALPTLAADLPRHAVLMGGNRVGKVLAQVEITADALVVVAIEAEDGFGVRQVDGVFDLAVFADALSAVKREIQRQGLQFMESVRKAGGFLNSDVFLLAILGPGPDLVLHKISVLSAHSSPILPDNHSMSLTIEREQIVAPEQPPRIRGRRYAGMDN